MYFIFHIWINFYFKQIGSLFLVDENKIILLFIIYEIISLCYLKYLYY